ncbi:MAG: class I SAM-dependent methyltransferase [Anaerolineales bacterium]|uniref:class I SAM-dependent methyltransferase n=1 Tax=Candidatus Villigracilis vicinus TaxID=3140679 RepID=UPI0031351AB9|nr:class I SAM-dependent methyltransferase [Anaerolineales bacterium]
MKPFTIEEDYLGEFMDPVNYDLEVGGENPSHRFYADLAKQIRGNVLEVACGTGLVAIPLALQGIPLTGMDIVPAMLTHAQKKSEALNLSIRWFQGDARNFNLNEQFNFIYMTGNAFQAFLNNADQRDLLQNIRKHLAIGGVFAFETRNPNWEECSTDLNETEWMTYTNDKGYSVRITETRVYDHVAQVLVYNLYRRWKEENRGKERATRIAIRYTFPQELNALLERNEFQILHQYGNWDKSPLTKDSPIIISVCKLV